MAKDLHLQLIDPLQQQAGVNFTWGTAPRLVDGPQKLANQWLKLFLTPKNTHPWRPNEGTNFAYLLGGYFTDASTLQVEVLQHIDDANQQMKDRQAVQHGLPANERFSAANLTQFTQTAPDAFDIWVEIVNVAGDRIPVLIPYARI